MLRASTRYRCCGRRTLWKGISVSELVTGFQSLPPEYQHVLLLAQEEHQIRVAPLQTLVGGWSGAMVFLVSVTHLPAQRVEHLILKLDRKSPKARSDELSRHVTG